MQAATQKAKILQYCEEHGSITNREAFEKLFINSLKKAGYDVRPVVETRVNAAGETVRFNRYFIGGKKHGL